MEYWSCWFGVVSLYEWIFWLVGLAGFKGLIGVDTLEALAEYDQARLTGKRKSRFFERVQLQIFPGRIIVCLQILRIKTVKKEECLQNQ
jgi:hypothetical protein